MQHSAGDTLFRAVIMGTVVGLMGWGALRYPFIPRFVVQRLITWYEAAAADQRNDRPDESWGAPRPFARSPDEQPLWQAGSQGAGGAESSTPGSALQAAAAAPAPGEFPSQPASFTAPLTAAATRAAPGGERAGRRAQIERRLQQLGAVYSLLEMWGHEDCRFRFHCKVALAGGGAETRIFEATAADAQQAMETVLRDVETWRGQVDFAERNGL